MSAFWGGLGFGAMFGGTIHLVRHSDEAYSERKLLASESATRTLGIIEVPSQRATTHVAERRMPERSTVGAGLEPGRMTETRVLIASDGSGLAMDAARRSVQLLSADAVYTVLTVVHPVAVTAGLDVGFGLAGASSARRAGQCAGTRPRTTHGGPQRRPRGLSIGLRRLAWLTAIPVPPSVEWRPTRAST